MAQVQNMFSDIAANVALNLDALQARVDSGDISTITLTDQGVATLTLDSAQLISDAGALGLINGNFSITATGTINASDATSISPTLLARLGNGLLISDYAANLAASLDALQVSASHGKISAIALIDPSTTITIGANQLTTDQLVLSYIPGNCSVSATGTLTAAQAIALPSSLTARLASGLQISDQAAALTAGLDKVQALVNAGVVSTISLVDRTTPTLNLTVAQLQSDGGAIGAITSSFKVLTTGTLTIANAAALPLSTTSLLQQGLALSDTLSNVTANLDAIQDMVTRGLASSITLTDPTAPTLTIDAGQLSNYNQALGLINSDFKIMATGSIGSSGALAIPSSLLARLTTGLTISDYTTGLAANLDALHVLAGRGQISSISVIDDLSPLNITTDQLLSDADILGKIQGQVSISATGAVTASSAASLTSSLSSKLVTGLNVNDTAANVVAKLDTLQKLENAGTIASISLSDTSSPTLIIPTSQLDLDGQTLAAIKTSFKITATGSMTVNQATSLPVSLASKLTSSLSIFDTNNTASNLDTLQALVINGTIASITLTDQGTPTLQIDTSQLSADGAALGLIHSAMRLAATGNITSADALALTPGLLTKLSTGLHVTDTTTNLADSLDGLQNLASSGHLSTISLIDDLSPLNITARQLFLDHNALASIQSLYGISATGTMSAANAVAIPTTLANELLTGLQISDTAQNVSSNLDALQAMSQIYAITSITLTDQGTPTLTLTDAQLTKDSSAISLILGDYVTASQPYPISVTNPGTTGNDAITGANAIFWGGPGNDIITGMSGVNTAVYSGQLNQYTITNTSGVVKVVDTTALRDGNDTLTNIQHLQFTDYSINTTMKAEAAKLPTTTVNSLVELYVAYFARTPDATGLAYWIDKAAAGESLTDISKEFYSAGVQYSSVTGYSATMSNSDFIKLVYANVLDRTGTTAPPDADVAYWNNQIQIGATTKEGLIQRMLSDAHSFANDPTWGWVPQLLNNKITVGYQSAVTIGLDYNSPTDAITTGMAIAQAVTPSDTSAAVALIGVGATIHL